MIYSAAPDKRLFASVNLRHARHELETETETFGSDHPRGACCAIVAGMQMRGLTLAGGFASLPVVLRGEFARRGEGGNLSSAEAFSLLQTIATIARFARAVSET